MAALSWLDVYDRGVVVIVVIGPDPAGKARHSNRKRQLATSSLLFFAPSRFRSLVFVNHQSSTRRAKPYHLALTRGDRLDTHSSGMSIRSVLVYFFIFRLV